MASPVTDLKLVARYAHTELVIERELPHVMSIPEMVKEWHLDVLPQETMWVIVLDSLQHVRTVVEIAKGNYHEVEIPLAALLSVPLLATADRIILMHNHPAGDVTPTLADLNVAHKVMAACNLCGIYLDDSVIVAPGGKFFSMLDNGLIKAPAEFTNQRKRAYRRPVLLPAAERVTNAQ